MKPKADISNRKILLYNHSHQLIIIHYMLAKETQVLFERTYVFLYIYMNDMKTN